MRHSRSTAVKHSPKERSGFCQAVDTAGRHHCATSQGKLAARAHRQAAAASEAAAAVAHERLAAIRTVRSFNQEAAEGDRRERI